MGATWPASAMQRREELGSFFSSDEIDQLERARTSVQLDRATIAYCVYENPFARSGGIFAVAVNYCAELQRQGKKVVAVTPFHSKLRSAPGASDLASIGECEVAFGGESVRVEILEHEQNDVRWILLRAEGFFESDGGAGGGDPYVDSNEPRLLKDSLFFSAAIPSALSALGMRNDLLLHVQDWEVVSTALTAKLALLDGRLQSAAVVLTTHNPYDHELSAESLRLLTDRECRSSATTVYQHMIPLTDGPTTTVSQTFAKELTADPLQTYHFANHLQQTFGSHGIVGVDNGLFGNAKQTYSDQALAAIASGNAEPILKEKAAKRERMLGILADYNDDRILGSLTGRDGGPLNTLPDDVPIFVMFGRMDPGQKGFDVLSRAIEKLPREWGRFILTPIVTGQSSFTDDLRQLAESRAGEVAVYPFRMDRGYMEAMAGATYAVMPSLYEPFGGATEPYLEGTPVVARSAGGLVQQVSDVTSDPDHATGILYRESTEGTGEEWRELQVADTPAERVNVPVYNSMTDALVEALHLAGDIHQSQSLTYAKMLSRLFHRATMFSWSRAAEEYVAVYKLATE